MIFRRAGLGDVEELISLRLEMHHEIRHQPRDETEVLRDYFGRTLPSEAFIAWVVEDGGRLVSTSGLVFYEPPSGKTAYLMNMYTVPSHRGRGLAAELVTRLLDEARSRGARYVRLRFEPKAKALYERAGFLQRDNEMERSL